MVSLHQQKMVALHDLTLMEYLLLVVALISVFITVAISAIRSVHTQRQLPLQTWCASLPESCRIVGVGKWRRGGGRKKREGKRRIKSGIYTVLLS